MARIMSEREGLGGDDGIGDLLFLPFPVMVIFEEAQEVSKSCDVMIECCEGAVDEGRESESCEMAVLGRKKRLLSGEQCLKSQASQLVAAVIHCRFTYFRWHMI